MKICFIGDARSVHLRRWIDYLVMRGDEIDVISYHSHQFENASLHIIKHRRNRLLLPFTYVYETLKIAAIIYKIQPDIVHLHYVSIDGLAPALFKRFPLIVTPWGSDILYDLEGNPKFRVIIKFILRKADLITTTTEFLANEVRKQLTQPKKIEIIPFGVDIAFFRTEKRQNKKKKQITLVFIKSLESHYGPQYLLQAMPHVLKEHPSTKLIFAGSGSQKIKLETLAQGLNIAGNVCFAGRLDHHGVRELLRESDIFIMPTSCQEAFGVSALEAQAMAVPVIATKKGGIPEVVKDGETGLLVEARDSQQLAQAILKLIENPQLRLKMGELGRKFVTANFSWEKCAKDMIEIYHGIAKETRKKT